MEKPGSAPLSPSPLPLKGRIVDKLVYSFHDQQKFLPADMIEKFTTRDEIETACREQKKKINCDEKLVSFASGAGKRTFLTLVKMEKLKLLRPLLESGFSDDNLPVHCEKKKQSGPQNFYDVGSLDEDSNTLRSERWEAFSG